MVEGLALLRKGQLARGDLRRCKLGIDGWRASRRPPQSSVPEVGAGRSAGACRATSTPACSCWTSAWSRSSGPDGTSGSGSPKSCGSRAGCSCARASVRRPRRSCARRSSGRGGSRPSPGSCAARRRSRSLLIEGGRRDAAREVLAPDLRLVHRRFRHPRSHGGPRAAGGLALIVTASHDLDRDERTQVVHAPHDEEAGIAARRGIGGNGCRYREVPLLLRLQLNSEGVNSRSELAIRPPRLPSKSVAAGTRRTARLSLLRSVIEMVARWPGLTVARGLNSASASASLAAG